MKKNLLMIVANMSLGGQQRVVANTAAILAERYNITIALFSQESEVYNTPCRVIDLNIPASNSYFKKLSHTFRRKNALKKLKRELNIEVSISFGGTANVANVLSRVADKIIISVRGYQNLSTSLVSRIIDQQVYKRADLITCVAQKLSWDLTEIYHLPADKVVTIYNPYDFDSITKQASLAIPLTIRHPAIVTMGRLEKVKGYSHLLKAFKLVHKAIPEASLIIVGAGHHSENLKQLATSLGLTEQVVFVGFQSNPFSYVSKCDLYVLSSIHEGFPNALVEAMTCGLPVVATDCKSGPREIISEKYCDIEATEVEYTDYGILTPPFSADDRHEPERDKLLAEAIISILKDKKMSSHYKRRSLDRARAFSSDVYEEQIIKIIEGL